MEIDQAKKYKELEQEKTRLKKLVTDLSIREVMLKDKYQISKQSFSLVGLSRTTWRHLLILRDDETPMRAEEIRLASTYGRYGYRTIASNATFSLNWAEWFLFGLLTMLSLFLPPF